MIEYHVKFLVKPLLLYPNIFTAQLPRVTVLKAVVDISNENISFKCVHPQALWKLS